MADSLYLAFAGSLLRTLLMAMGGWLVSRGLVDDGMMQEVAAGAAVLLVTQGWNFWRIHKRALYQRWLLALGLQEPPTLDPEVAAGVREDARLFTQEGREP